MNKLLCLYGVAPLSQPDKPLCVCLFRLIAGKRFELGEQVSKLRNGLLKISDTREKVKTMSEELEEAKKQVAVFQKQCDEYLSVIVQQKTEADKQQKVCITNMLACRHSDDLGILYRSQ